MFNYDANICIGVVSKILKIIYNISEKEVNFKIDKIIRMPIFSKT